MQASRKLASLEASLGHRLIHRSTRTLSITSEGHDFLPYAVDMVNIATSAKLNLANPTSDVRGLLKVSTPTIFGENIVAKLLKEMLDDYPELQVELNISDTFVDVIGDGYDVAIRNATPRDSGLIFRRIAKNPRILCAAPSYLDTFGQPLKLNSLLEHECLQHSSVPRWTLSVNGDVRYLRTNGRFSTGSTECLKQAAVEGRGIALLTYWDVKPQLESGELISITLEDADMEALDISALLPTRRQIPARVDVFLSRLQKYMTDRTLI